MKNFLIRNSISLCIALFITLPLNTTNALEMSDELKKAEVFFKEKKYDIAKSMVLELAESGDRTAQNLLSGMYEVGAKPFEKDIEKSQYWLKKAADAGQIDAQYKWANMNFDKNRTLAYKMLLDAAQKGHSEAQSLFIKNNTQPKVQAQKPIIDNAIKWASQGNVDLMIWLADNYYSGNQLPKEYKNAGIWYTKAGKRKNTWAEYRLGYMYYSGLGIKSTLIGAQEWLSLAAKKDYAPAIKLLKNVNAKIAAKNAEYARLQENVHKEEREVARLQEEVRKQEIKLKNAKKIKTLEEKLVTLKAKEKEAKLVNTLLAQKNKFRAGTAFKLIKNAPLRTNKIRVTEYFLYGCKGCYMIQKNVNKWKKSLKNDVQYESAHISIGHTKLSHFFYTLKEMGIEKELHSKIHEQTLSGKPLYTKENEFLDFISKNDVDIEAFNKIYFSPEIEEKTKTHRNHENSLGFKSVPAFSVNGQYYVTPVTAGASRPYLDSDLSKDELEQQIELRMFEIIDYLISIEREILTKNTTS